MLCMLCWTTAWVPWPLSARSLLAQEGALAHVGAVAPRAMPKKAKFEESDSLFGDVVAVLSRHAKTPDWVKYHEKQTGKLEKAKITCLCKM